MTEDTTVKQLYRRAIPSVVSVYVTADDGRPSGGAGSGFVYDESHLITNQHVVGESDDVELRFHDGAWRTAAVVGTDPYTDLAVLRVDDLPADAAPLPVATANPEPGERVAAIGNPMGLDGTITVGYVSGINRSNRTGSGFSLPETIQTDAAVNPGNSGGPLLTLEGTVVGVNRARGGDNIGFAIGPTIVRRVVPALIAEGRFSTAYLAVRTLDVSPTVAEANGLTESSGVLVVDVGEAYEGEQLQGCNRTTHVRGREVPTGGDVVVSIDGRPVRSTEELLSYLLVEATPGETVELTLRRNAGASETPRADGEAVDGVELTETATLNERPAPDPRPRRRRHWRSGGRRIPVR